MAEDLMNATIRTRALGVLQGLIERVSVHTSAEGDGAILELEGAITAMIEEAQPGVDHESVKMQWLQE